MRLEQSFEVPVPVAQAWGVLLDLERIAPCMPGATLTSFDGDAFTGTVKVKLGPVSLAYRGSGRFTERDEEGRRLSIVAQGQDSRGAGGASARINAVLHTARDGEATLVKVVADVDIAGRAAQFGRGMIADVSGKLVKQFADCLAQTIAAAPAAAAPAPASAAPAAAPPPPAPVSTPVFAPPVPAPAAPATAVDAAPPPAAPPLAPVFTEPASPPPPAPEPAYTPLPSASTSEAADTAPPSAATPEPVYTPPTPANSAPPEYHPLAMEEPADDAASYPSATPASTPWPEPEPVSKPESAYVYAPEPTPPPSAPPPTPSATPAAPVPAAAAVPERPAPVEAEPIDLLAISGAKGMLRRAAPVLIIVGLALIGLVIWLVVAR